MAQLKKEDVSQAFAESLTDVTLQLYSALLEKLPPTPSRFHYVFNLRDLSRVYEGLLRSTADTVQQPSDFLRLWRNEVSSAASRLGGGLMVRGASAAEASCFVSTGRRHLCRICCSLCFDELTSACMCPRQPSDTDCCLKAMRFLSCTACSQLLRVFHDRLISEDDKTIFKSKVEELVQARCAQS